MNTYAPVILDLNTQRDLFTAEGIYPLLGTDPLRDALKRVFTWAQKARIPVVSTRLRYLFAPIPSTYGLAGGSRLSQRLICNPQAPGYQKIPFTLLRKRQELPMDCETSLPVDGFKTTQQFIFDLPSLNPFECPRLDRLMTESEVPLWIIVGGPMEWTVRTAVLGLLQRRQKVALISDALGSWDQYEGSMALRQIESKNVQWLTSQQVGQRFGKPQPVRPSLLAEVRPTTAAPAAPTPDPAVHKTVRANGRRRSTTTRKGSAQRQKLPTRQFR